MATSGTIRVRGQELYCEVHGEGEPLVLIMGIGYDSSLWLHQVPALGRAFKVVVFDNRDVGRSGRASGPYTIADMADDVAGMLDALVIPRAHVVGLSMGAMIAQEFALRHGDRLNRLVLSGADAGPARQVFHPIGVWNWVKANDDGGATFAAQQFVWLFSTAFLRDRAAVQQTLDVLSSNPHPVSSDAYARQAHAYLAYDPAGRLEGIKAPTLVIVGEQDLLTPPWLAREVAAAIPGAQLEIIAGDGASHVVPLERPEDFNRLVTRFLTTPSAHVRDDQRIEPLSDHAPPRHGQDPGSEPLETVAPVEVRS
jgi:pimeloyl-ACP methyl ester carboxylesterase